MLILDWFFLKYVERGCQTGKATSEKPGIIKVNGLKI